ncbi:hypothetical protein DXT68_02590 [Microbacterium foliorum]|uniref:Type VII secretion integral membrane protein EccD n=1 Tax=Microbacterium foliorum TaxID=104336 RepID=A0A0F0KFW9_9MICO|nr:hypothetical protein [Microbacterium foliorum]AXL11145.1 hypothetical protein DXT68_02590 [Microbacterium foliorum]KJL19324.1 hypothetical protein RN50_02609 [Microbacterium foliorum]
MSAKTIRLTVADANGRNDLVVPADSTVAELLTVGGVDLQRYVGTTTSGAAIDLDSEVSVIPGDGGVIWLFDRAATAQTTGSEASATDVSTAGQPRRNTLLLALLLAITMVLVSCAVIMPSATVVSVATVLLLVGALTLLAQPVRDSTIYVALVAPVLGGAAGAVALSVFHDTGAMMAAGFVTGATLACVRHAQALMRGRLAAATTAVIAVMWSVLAVLNAAAFLAGVPAVAITAVQVACAVPVFHFIRAAALDVDASELIDTPYVIRDAQGLRQTPPREPSPVGADTARRQFQLARRRSEAGIVIACALALLSTIYTVVVTAASIDTSGPSVETWCVLGGALGVGCYFLLTARMLRDGVARAAALVTGTVVAVTSAAALVIALQLSALLVAVVVIIAGAIVASLTVPLARDWRSLGWSRTGDIVEGLFLALAPAALLYGSGIAGQILEVFS